MKVPPPPLGWCGHGSLQEALGDGGAASPVLGVKAWMGCGLARVPSSRVHGPGGQHLSFAAVPYALAVLSDSFTFLKSPTPFHYVSFPSIWCYEVFTV